MTASTDVDPSIAFELAALRLHLAVGMAAADEQVTDEEIADLSSFVQHAEVSDKQRTYLGQLLAVLVKEPPALDTLLRSLVDRMDRPELAQLLVDDLVAIAQADDHIDPREEGLMRLVCGALEIPPVSLYEPHERAVGDASAADLARLVRQLLDLDAAA
jgi:tellurite resistance protein